MYSIVSGAIFPPGTSAKKMTTVEEPAPVHLYLSNQEIHLNLPISTKVIALSN